MPQAWLQAVQAFAAGVSEKLQSAVRGEPEEQLRAGVEALLKSAADQFNLEVLVKGESAVRAIGRPDFAVAVAGPLTGHVELKKPGAGARTSKYRGRDKEQWTRFAALPNLIYTDGNEWALYRTGKLKGKIVHISGDIVDDGAEAITQEDATAIGQILLDFFQWQPVVPSTAEELAELIAPLCRLLRDEVVDALTRPGSALQELKRDWQELLFPDATEPQFADAYAQTVTFALLLSRSEGWRSQDLDDAVNRLRSQHGLLSRALEVLTDEDTVQRIATSLDVLRRVIAAVEPAVMQASPENEPRLIEELSLRPDDPWTYFYEDFLAAYDKKLRKDAGVYYTPVQVVRCQVRLIDHLLKTRLGKPAGFADPSVNTLDPAMGTGTYLLGVIDHALDTAWRNQGRGAMAGVASQLASTLHGFERLVGPYAVAELRLSQAIQRFKGAIPDSGLSVLLTDTLESPRTEPQFVSAYHRVIGEQHRRALEVKNDRPILVCLGNPPYDRHEASTNPAVDRGRTGAWVRHGDPDDPGQPILEDFLEPARRAGHGGDLKNLYNLYVYFWRWALWKTFECTTDGSGGPEGPGVVSFITASSFLTGDAFVGVRKMLREQCDAVYILDLGGEGRGTRKEDNVFAIQTPVCITLGYRVGAANPEHPAEVYYRRVRGTRAEKFDALDSLNSLEGVADQRAPDGWLDPFTPATAGKFAQWPELRDLFPWQHSGAQIKRTWPIGASKPVLEKRWAELLRSSNRADAFKETRDRRIDKQVGPVFTEHRQPAISELDVDTPMLGIRPYAYRSFDRQWLIADNRVADYVKPDLWATGSKKQVFLGSLSSNPLGAGPALTASGDIPDLHFFRGSYGAKDSIPLYRDGAAEHPNVWPGLLDYLTAAYARKVTAEDFAAYVYGVLAHPHYTSSFWDELEACEVRVPLTRDANLFEEAAKIGRTLIHLHTYGQRFVPEGEMLGNVPRGKARCVVAVPDAPDRYPEHFDYDAETSSIRVGAQNLFEDGAGVFAPVSPAVWDFEVSGLMVVQSWLGYRMAERSGRTSSSLDEIRPERWTPAMTTQFLELLWVLEATLAVYPQQAELLDEVLAGPLFEVSDLPDRPARNAPCRKPPRDRDDAQQTSMFDD